MNVLKPFQLALCGLAFNIAYACWQYADNLHVLVSMPMLMRFLLPFLLLVFGLNHYRITQITFNNASVVLTLCFAAQILLGLFHKFQMEYMINWMIRQHFSMNQTMIFGLIARLLDIVIVVLVFLLLKPFQSALDHDDEPTREGNQYNRIWLISNVILIILSFIYFQYWFNNIFTTLLITMNRTGIWGITLKYVPFYWEVLVLFVMLCIIMLRYSFSFTKIESAKIVGVSCILAVIGYGLVLFLPMEFQPVQKQIVYQQFNGIVPAALTTIGLAVAGCAATFFVVRLFFAKNIIRTQ